MRRRRVSSSMDWRPAGVVRLRRWGQCPRRGGIEAVAHAVFIRVVYGSGTILAIRSGNMMARRSTGKTRMARALWYVKKGTVELRSAPLPPPGPGYAPRPQPVQRHQPRHGTAGFTGRHWPKRMGAHAGTDAGGRLSVPGQVWLLRDRQSSRTGQPISLAARSSRCIRTRTTSMSPLDALVPVPEALPARRATLGRQHGNRAQRRSGTAAPARAIASWSSGPASLGCWWRRSRPACPVPCHGRGRRASSAGLWPKRWALGFARPEHAPARCRRRVPCQRHGGRPRCRHPLCRPRGAPSWR